MTYHTKPVPCDGQTKKLPCGCEECLSCGSFILITPFSTAGNPVHVHTVVTS